MRLDDCSNLLLKNANAVPVVIGVDTQIAACEECCTRGQRNAIFGAQFNITIAVNFTRNENRLSSIGNALCHKYLSSRILRNRATRCQMNALSMHIAADLNLISENLQPTQQDNILNNFHIPRWRFHAQAFDGIIKLNDPSARAQASGGECSFWSSQL